MQPSENSPFGSRTSRRNRIIRLILFGAAAAAVLVAVIRWSRRDVSGQTGGHDMASMQPRNPSDQPVRLESDNLRRIGVTFAAVTSGPVTRTVRVVGLVKEDETRVRAITTRVDGFVERLDADYTGRLVRAGEPLLGLYSPEIVAAGTELLLALELARSLRDGDPEARASAERTVEAARQRLRQWQVPDDVVGRIEQSGAVDRVMPLRSPYDGFVVEKSVVLGQRVMAGDPLYRLADLGVVWVEGEVYEQDLPLVRVGVSVTATFQALPGVERSGDVTYVYPTVDPATRTARIRIELANRDLRLKPGMYGLLQFDSSLDEGLSVPRSAIVATGTRNLVFIKLADGRFEPREVVLGVGTSDRVQLLHGVSLGDTVVASGTFLMDAESNLGSLLGGMGDMPGMDLRPPRKVPPRRDSADKPPPGHSDHGTR